MIDILLVLLVVLLLILAARHSLKHFKGEGGCCGCGCGTVSSKKRFKKRRWGMKIKSSKKLGFLKVWFYLDTENVFWVKPHFFGFLANKNP